MNILSKAIFMIFLFGIAVGVILTSLFIGIILFFEKGGKKDA